MFRSPEVKYICDHNLMRRNPNGDIICLICFETIPKVCSGKHHIPEVIDLVRSRTRNASNGKSVITKCKICKQQLEDCLECGVYFSHLRDGLCGKCEK